MNSISGDRHPFRLLLILEWILLGIAVLMILSPGRIPLMPHRGVPPDFRIALKLVALGGVAGLGLLGLRLPPPSRGLRVSYIALGFGLSWFVVMLGGRALSVFPALLLVVVMRACLLFPWSGRLLVAGLAYGSFLLLQIMALVGARPLGVPVGRSLPPIVQRLPPDTLRNVLLGLMLNTALLFGLVLIFVLLLVSTVVAEHQSRQALTAAHQRLRDYALMIENQATLHERNRIAREIHDSVGHALAAQSIQLENVAVTLEAKQLDGAVQHLQKARNLGREALQSVRQSVANLRNDPLKHQALSEAIASLLNDFQRNYPISVKAEISPTIPLAGDQKLALYRIVQEALTNIVKHSQASQVHFQLTSHASSVVLSIQDNGMGFNPASNTTGFGIQSMRERTEALGGQFTLTSQPGQGCQIQVTVPCLSR